MSAARRKRDPEDDERTMKKIRTTPKSTLKLSALPAERKSTKPLSAVRKLTTDPLASVLDCRPTQQSWQPSAKGKEKELSVFRRPDRPEERDSSMWIDIFEPQTEDELVVHKKKVDQVRMWLKEATLSPVLRKYRRILALTGPAGAGKTAALRVLAREMDLDIVEWRNASEDTQAESYDADRESLSRKFSNFLARAASYSTVVGTSSLVTRQRIVVLEDLPNVLHPIVLSHFQAALLSFVEQPHDQSCPLVIIVSDAGVRGELRDEHGFGGSGAHETSTVSIRTLLPMQLQQSQFVAQVAFNPVAPTRMRKALQSVLAQEEPKRKGVGAAELLDAVVTASSGDIRSAIMALQFACIMDTPAKKGAGKKKGSKDILEAITKRESSLALFHLLGKILYNKRKGDPPSASASAKDTEREKEADRRLRDPPKLPPHLRSEHARPSSRVDIAAIYADSPVDTSLLSLYLHQNFPQFTGDIDNYAGVSEWFSTYDACMRVDEPQWNRTMPHQFYTLTLGILHNLPAPVARNGQKMYKPELFDVFKKAHEAELAVRDVRAWLAADMLSTNLSETTSNESASPPRRVWSQAEAVLELGGILAAREFGADQPPSSHERFSRLAWTSESNDVNKGAQALDEDEAADLDVNVDEGVLLGGGVAVPRTLSAVEKEQEHGWLEADLIVDD
ncbi:P-loop containing nucleoside triphosphate hydrolase protein [Auriculariales sp. MPI-PUGE-AT-0066]|nr:P-loop containing nucleoside triphosphate hydrolase protein [Auriculariales sp. MPI-PUGE-AT-0066]